jgi:hypothetical protein
VKQHFLPKIEVLRRTREIDFESLKSVIVQEIMDIISQIHIELLLAQDVSKIRQVLLWKNIYLRGIRWDEACLK